MRRAVASLVVDGDLVGAVSRKAKAGDLEANDYALLTARLVARTTTRSLAACATASSGSTMLEVVLETLARCPHCKSAFRPTRNHMSIKW